MLARTPTTRAKSAGSGALAGPANGAAPASHPPRRNAAAAGGDSVSNLGFWFLLVFVFFSCSRVLDFTLNGLHLPLILSVLAAIFTLLGGGFQAAFKTRIGKLMGLFTCWLLVCTAFSSWRGGSFGMLQETWSRSFLVFIIVAGATTTTNHVRRMMIAIGLGAAAAMAMAHLLHGNVDGRLSLPFGGLGNPNDFGQVLLVGACFISVLLNGGKSLLARLVVPVLLLAFLYSIVETGSRGVLLGALAIGILAFFQVSMLKKVVLLVTFVIGGVGMFAVSPIARTRMATILFSNDDRTSSDKPNSSEEMAVASTEDRSMLLQESLWLTLRHPLFGVGPGVFESSAAAMSHESGKRALWRETHNAYTQVSSETGIPGALFFLGAVGSCFVGLIRVRKRTNGRPQHRATHAVATHILAGFVTFAFTSLFSSVAYQFYFSLLIGLCAATISAAEKELALDPAPQRPLSSQPVVPTPRLRQARDPVAKRLRA